MNIALLAHENKKDLLIDFCEAYLSILKKHYLCSTEETAKAINNNTGLIVERYLSYELGGIEQIASKISCGELDLILFFRDVNHTISYNKNTLDILRLCDIYNIPISTNIATSEALIHSLDRGDLDWRKTSHSSNIH